MPSSEIFLWSALGAGVAHFFALTNRSTSIKILPHFKQSWAVHPVGVLIEAIILISVGAIVGGLFTSPCTAQQAVIAGVGWTGALSLTTKCAGV